MSLDTHLVTFNVRNGVATKKSDKRIVPRFAKRDNPIISELMGELAWRLVIGAVERRVAMFFHSRFAELGVSEAGMRICRQEPIRHIQTA